MAGIDTGDSSGGRAVNRDIPLVPFIDFLLCLISFLLITAVWSQNARIEASAELPGEACAGCTKPKETPKQLHVAVRERKFELTWKQGDTVLARHEIERKPVRLADGDPSYPDLARRIAEEWRQGGTHRAPSDPVRDQAVLHSTNSLEFGELAAVMDAIGSAKREREVGGARRSVPAFDVSFAVN
jgi:biopolymer transport protein ExbD